MKIIRQNEVSKQTVVSPKGNFALNRQHISLALGGVKDSGAWAGGLPFDIELATLPSGKRNWPLHAHAAQTEHFIIVSGNGILIDESQTETPITAGDHIICLPGEAHQLLNNSNEDLVYYVIADHHPADITNYPKTGKKMLKPGDECIRPQEAHYYEGEE